MTRASWFLGGVRAGLTIGVLVGLPAYTATVSAAARPKFTPQVERAIAVAEAAYQLPPGELARIVWCESRGVVGARNGRSGAAGLAQIMPSTFARTPYGRAGLPILDPIVNALAAGAWYRMLGGRWGGRGGWACARIVRVA